jgi:hypothetical protein
LPRQVENTQKAASRQSGSKGQGWLMLLFESVSAGVISIFVLFVVIMAVVGVYVIVVWPLTFWDLDSLGLEKYAAWAKDLLWSVFAGGTLAGLWCFSGAAFRGEKKAGGRPSLSKSKR